MIASAPFLIWGLVLHLIADWPLQNEWMAQNKAKRLRIEQFVKVPNGSPELNIIGGGQVQGSDGYASVWKLADGPWWLRHPAAYVHAGIHGAIQLLVFPWWAALFIGVTHLLIDLRTPVEWWSRLIRQTQPSPDEPILLNPRRITHAIESGESIALRQSTFDVGMEVRFWTDQVFHIAVVAIAALLVTV